MIEDQKTGVYAVGDAIDRQVDRVGMATEPVCRFKQRDLGGTGQPVRHGQARDAGTYDGNAAHQRPLWVRAALEKSAAQRPGVNEGGREEEERNPGISADKSGWLRNSETSLDRWAAPAAARLVTALSDAADAQEFPAICKNRTSSSKLNCAVIK